MKKPFIFFLLLSSFTYANTVYVVLSSDTSIWSTYGGFKYNTNFNFDVFTNPDRVYREVMDESFRNAHMDSAGQSFKVSWFMLGGAYFTTGINTNSVSTTYLIRKYWGNEIERWGDEIAYHFHHYAWTGSEWIIAPTFMERAGDFDWTMSQTIIDESIYTVSFRSGWNYMDTIYQNYLEPWIPFRLEGAAGMTDYTPYHPSFADYRVPGDMKGWEARHIYTKSFSASVANTIFNTASMGKPQVVCIWSHQNETDFPQQIADVDANLHTAWNNHPSVPFFYCTAKEAMTFYQIYDAPIPMQGKSQSVKINPQNINPPVHTTQDLESPSPSQNAIPKKDVVVSATPTPVIVDNDAGSPSYVETGTWTTSGSTGYNGGIYRYAGTGTASTATWNANLPQAGFWEVSTAYLQSTNRASNVRFIINAPDGTHDAFINQNGAQQLVEISLGRYLFNEGATSVILDAQDSEPSGSVVISDAILFNWAAEQEPTPTHTPTPTPSPTPTPPPTITPLPQPDFTPPYLNLVTTQKDLITTVVIHSAPDIYQIQPWVAIRDYTDQYSRLDTQKIAPGKWRFFYDSKQIDTAVVGVCDIYGNVSMSEVRDGSRRITNQGEFYQCQPQNLVLDVDPSKIRIVESLDLNPILSQNTSTSLTLPLTRSYWIGQVFKPLATGISKINIAVRINSPSRFLIEFRPLLPNGFPNDDPGALLGSYESPLIEATGYIEATFDDLNGLILDGRSYAFVVKLLSGSSGTRLHTTNPYTDGYGIRSYSMDWVSLGDYDCQFQVYDQNETLSIDQSTYNGNANPTTIGYYAYQTVQVPGDYIKAVDVKAEEASTSDVLELQIRKTLENGNPDFSFDSILFRKKVDVNAPGIIRFPISWDIPQEFQGESLALCFVNPMYGLSSIRLGNADGNPYPDGEMFVSEDLKYLIKHPDNDLYFTIYTNAYTTLTTGSLVYEYDAERVVDWNGVKIEGETPEDTFIKTRYRFAETKEDLENAAWSDYYDVLTFDFAGSPNGRYVQCEIVLGASGEDSPILDSFEIFFLKAPEGITQGTMFH